MSEKKYNNVGAVVLAAGKGTRLGCIDAPKVMLEIGGKPIVEYVVEKLELMGFGRDQICLVVGFQKEKVKEYFGDRVIYADQNEQNGTAHAAFLGMKTLPKNIDQVLVLGGDDSAFYTKKSLEKFIEGHIEKRVKLSLLGVDVEDPAGLGRIVRHESGDIEVIEKEYITEDQAKIKEVSTGTFMFDREWFESIFPQMPLLRKLGEYGLPTALAMARKQDVLYQVVPLGDSNEWLGINTPEQLKEANKKITK